MLINIQFLRFFAAMLVVLYHTAGQVPGGDSAAHGLFALGRLTGFAGVDVFFVISGFIMAHTTMNQQGMHESSDFARRRLARIYSGHWPFFLLTLLVFYWARPGHFEESNLVASFFLWPLPLNQTLLEITWTLSFELYFYLLFAIIIWWVPASKRVAVCSLMMLSLLALTSLRHFGLESFGPEKLYFMPFAMHFLLSPFMLEFFAGALLAYWLQQNPDGYSRLWLWAGIGMFLLSAIVNATVYDGVIEQGFHVVPRVFWFGGAAIMIVIGLVRLENRSVTAPRSFSLRTGGASYAIYLGHIPILVTVQKLGMPAWLSSKGFLFTAVAYFALMALILAYSVWHFERLERPLHRWFKRTARVRQGSR